MWTNLLSERIFQVEKYFKWTNLLHKQGCVFQKIISLSRWKTIHTKINLGLRCFWEMQPRS